MTDKQLLALKHKARDEGNPKVKKELQDTIWCIDMINSTLAYNNFQTRGLSAEEVMKEDEGKKYQYLTKYANILGRDKVVELIQNQMNDIYKVQKGTFTDNEGLTYNSIIWNKYSFNCKFEEDKEHNGEIVEIIGDEVGGQIPIRFSNGKVMKVYTSELEEA